jgi:hypothetical protein
MHPQINESPLKRSRGRPQKFGVATKMARIPATMSGEDVSKAVRAKKLLRYWRQEALLHSGPEWELVKQLLSDVDL